MTPLRPHLLRAFYNWLLANQLTPNIVVDVNQPGVQVPMEFARDGQIVLNVAPHAVGNLDFGDHEVRFNARFGGVPKTVIVPVYAVMAIYARENGAGTMFEPEAAYQTEQLQSGEPLESSTPNKPTMTVVEGSSKKAPSDDDEPPMPPRGRPSLRIIK